MIRRIRSRRINESIEEGYYEISDAALDVKDALRRLNNAIRYNLEAGDLGVGDFAIMVNRMVRDVNKIIDAVDTGRR